jgi:hypothetical protein
MERTWHLAAATTFKSPKTRAGADRRRATVDRLLDF